MKIRAVFLVLSFALLILSGCHYTHKVNTSFYYWKTVYKINANEVGYLRALNVRKLYTRIMDIDIDGSDSLPVPISPITFKNKLPDSLQIVPVVFIVNGILKSATKPQLKDLAGKISAFVNAKVKQAGKRSFKELQMDCDWTSTTRENYFFLLKSLRSIPQLQHKIISATLRLHQLKDQTGSGIPPVDRVMLMCYNMGNLRKYGDRNSILDIRELTKYVNNNIARYPMPVDIGLPLFSWTVAFRNREYIGISKRIKKDDLINKNQFTFIGNNIYKAAEDLPEFGLNKADEVRWEDISLSGLETAAGYLSSLIKADTINVTYFHLDEPIIKAFTLDDLEKVNNRFR